EARGIKLKTLEGEATRPTLQRAKEVIFSAIQFDIEGRRVLDLFAGSGQLGLEALSRGAEHAVLVDKSPEAFDTIKENAQKTRLYKKCRIENMDYAAYLLSAKRSGVKFDLVFLDPPYDSGLLVPSLKALYVNGLLSESAIVAAEWERDTLLEDNPQLKEMYDLSKLYKSGRIYFYKLTPEKGETV
ncbi:MAG: 16S rRNA (guanine(966)-N(2))-methyltransferase RsmD, partial [Clostridia bacterium]|nr:16S rRNA (guanine(966)-N(2))-methyltransferase RsmD [Clostridia bacterium]